MNLSRRRLLRTSALFGVAATLSSPALAATGDITAVQIETTGWSALVTIAGFTTGETFAFGDSFLSAAKFVLTVTTTGFDSSGGAISPIHTIWGTHVVRQAYPNNALNNETLGGGGVIVRIALSEWIASGDTVVANVAAGCFVNTGGAAQTSNVLTAFSCTNSSTYAHPGAMGQWAGRPYDKWTSNPTLSVTARHRLGIACVKIIITDGTHTVTTTATKVANQRIGTLASGYYAEEWSATCDLSTITQNIAVMARYQIFPNIGASFDSNTPTQSSDNKFVLGIANWPYWCDKSAALDVYAVVSTAGNDTTGISSATLSVAAALPYLTLAKALTVGTANIIYMRSASGGTYVFGGATVRPSNLNFWRRIMPYPGDGTITLTLAALTQPNVQALSVENCTFKMLAGSNQWLDGQGTDIYAWNGANFNANGQSSTVVPVIGGYNSVGCYVQNSTIDSAVSWGLGANFAAHVCLWYDGNVMTSTGSGSITAVHRMVANHCVDIMLQDPGSDASTAAKWDPMFVEFNSFFKCTDGAPAITYFYTATYGWSICGNIFERASGAISPLLQVIADSDTNTSTHGVIWHNTLAGQRFNLTYNDTGTTAHLMTGTSLKFNSFWQRAIKTDTFGTPNANRIGNWSDLYSVGYINTQEQSNSLTFANEYQGIGSAYYPTTPTGGSPVSTPNYTNDASATGSGVGNGNYLPTAGSTLLSGVFAGQSVLGWDLFGTPISNAGAGTVGAIQVAAAASGGGSLLLMGVGH